MTADEFLTRVSQGGVVPLSREEWESLASSFREVERHNTQLAGDLLVVERDGCLVAIEQPSKEARVARVLSGPEEADGFVRKRLEEYERMWDGCGVRIEYYEES